MIRHFGRSSWGGNRKLPYAFTEHGILMLSSVLNSDKAIEVNIQIMRTFSKLRELMLVHKQTSALSPFEGLSPFALLLA